MTDSSLVHGTGLVIGNFVTIEADVEIGDNVTIKEYAHIMRGTRIGNDCVIGEYVRTGEDCFIGNNVTVKCRATISPETKIFDDVFIGPHAMILHALPDGSHKPSEVHTGAYIGACALVGPNVIIGEKVVLGAMAYAHTDCKGEGTLWVGVPARRRR
jgi:UDP-2-acetamido-3-amino-2,3-dideoxy-glucuronate N-acetyltransferase